MADLVLTEAQQRALRLLLAAEPVPGSPVPSTHLLEQVAALIPCLGVRVTVADRDGAVLDSVSVPASRGRGGAAGGVVLLRTRNGPDLVVHLEVDRGGRPFTEHEMALARLLRPVLGRLLRERPSPHLPGDLTIQERRVLRQVATGRSNAEIAADLGIAPCTVRKHLEHAFPKLGVSNRLAAALAFAGRGGSEREHRVEIFA